MHFLSTNVIKKIKLRGFRMPHTLNRISTEFIVQQSQNWGTLDLTLQRLWQLSCCSALPLQCPGYHLLSWLVAEFDRCCPVSPLRVIRESVSNDWIKDSENPNIQTGRSQNCQYLQNGLSRDSTSSRQWMNFWLRQLCRRWGTTTGTCAARWCCLPSSPDWSPTRRSTTWPRNSSTSRRPHPSSLACSHS